MTSEATAKNENAKPLDQIDKKILELLQKDAELTHKEIANKLNRSITPIRARINRLKTEGYIKRYTVLLDGEKINKSLIAYTQVSLKKHTQKSLSEFGQQASALPEVMECYHMSGTYDFLLRIAIKDMHEYSSVLLAKLSLINNIATMNTFFVISELKYDTGFNL